MCMTRSAYRTNPDNQQSLTLDLNGLGQRCHASIEQACKDRESVPTRLVRFQNYQSIRSEFLKRLKQRQWILARSQWQRDRLPETVRFEHGNDQLSRGPSVVHTAEWLPVVLDRRNQIDGCFSVAAVVAVARDGFRFADAIRSDRLPL